MSQHQSYINLLPTETTGEKKSTEFQKTNLFGESMNLPESIILPNARTSQISSGLPRRIILYFLCLMIFQLHVMEKLYSHGKEELLKLKFSLTIKEV